MKTFEENFKTIDVHISTIKVGDTVLVEGKAYTVGKNNIKKDGFMGTTLFGDSYKLGYILVKKYTNIR